ncbi:MAG: hypothetical protein IPM80_02640 [Proteobacteria bacterium]|jgi:hypothetical protein|nr:hypothetical protein [Pseudomonadota bacterium]
MFGTRLRPHPPSLVTIEKCAASTRYRGTRASLIDFDLAEVDMFPVPGATTRGTRGELTWTMASVPDSDEFVLELHGLARRPVAIDSARRRAGKHAQNVAGATLERDVRAMVDQYNELGMNTLKLIEALVNRGERAATDAAELSTTLAHLKQVYSRLAQRNRAAIRSIPRA